MSPTITHPFDTVPMPGPWSADAACRGTPNPDGWFPESGYGIDPDVQATCDACPVRFDCLDYAVRWKIDYGVWGGLTIAARKRLRRQRLPIAGHVQAAELAWVAFLAAFIIIGLRLLGLALR